MPKQPPPSFVCPTDCARSRPATAAWRPAVHESSSGPCETPRLAQVRRISWVRGVGRSERWEWPPQRHRFRPATIPPSRAPPGPPRSRAFVSRCNVLSTASREARSSKSLGVHILHGACAQMRSSWPSLVVPQFECSVAVSQSGPIQWGRLCSQTECLGAGKVGSANDPMATAIRPGNLSASQ